MFEFKGRRSEKVLKAIRLEQFKSFLLIFIVILIPILGFIIWFGATKNLAGVLASLFLFVFMSIIMWLNLSMLISKRSLNKLYKVEEDNFTIVQINVEHLVYKDNYAKHIFRVSRITCVEDWGEYYEFSFKRMKHSGLVCQKDWLTVGTIEDFESFFKDKLVVKTEKQKHKHNGDIR